MFPLVRSALCLAALLALAAAALASTGCGAGGLSRGAVAGSVTIGGQPLAKGRILFLPLAPTSGPTVSAAIVDGQYRLSRREGPIAGRNRVEIEAALDLGFAIDDEAAFARRGGRPLPPNSVPPQFHRSSKLVCQVRAGEDNQFDVVIPAAGQMAAQPHR